MENILIINYNKIVKGKENSDNIIFDVKTLLDIKNNDYDKIFIISSSNKIGNFVDEKLFDLKLNYIKRRLELMTKAEIKIYYCPYNITNKDFIKQIEHFENITSEQNLTIL